jgi:hypothetical protein
MIERDGVEAFEEWKKRLSSSLRKVKNGSLESFINNYGEEEGKRRFENYVEKAKRTKENFIKEYGEEEGLKRFNEFVNKSKQNLENFINRYGEELGRIKYLEMNEKRKDKTPFSIKYWIDKNDGDVEKALKEYSKFQTRDLEYFVNKYGEEGEERYNKRCKKVSEWTTIHLVKCYSLISQELFKFIEKEFNIQNCNYGDRNGEYSINNKYRVDFIVNNKVIEFYGDYFHCNPNKYDKDFFNSLDFSFLNK